EIICEFCLKLSDNVLHKVFDNDDGTVFAIRGNDDDDDSDDNGDDNNDNGDDDDDDDDKIVVPVLLH
ncbi:hypothetical protein WUBG_09192, partial [Wuchereria bancrofti]